MYLIEFNMNLKIPEIVALNAILQKKSLLAHDWKIVEIMDTVVLLVSFFSFFNELFAGQETVEKKGTTGEQGLGSNNKLYWRIV